MPCRSDYMEPTPQESYNQKTAQLYLAFSEVCGQKTKPGVQESARNIYAGSDYTDKLCNLIQVYKSKYNRFIGSNHDLAADLHLWWVNHQKVDAKRIAEEQELSKMRDLAEQAMKKLTEEELNALLNYVRPK